MRSLFLVLLLISTVSFAQLPPQSLDHGATGLELQLRKLDNYHTVLHITAHPDDEDNGLLVELSRGMGVRTALMTLTRGAGGQNQIGDEQGIALSILRTEELTSMHRIDGAEQYFGRAVDFGYSFSVDETFEKWGGDEILRDIVYLIRKLKPDVIVCLAPRGGGGGQHHQASGVFSTQAFRMAADPKVFPDQIEKGLQPWQAKKLMSRAFRMSRSQIDPTKLIEVSTGKIDSLFGKTAYQMGREARSFHICQDMNRVPPLPGNTYSRFVLEDTVLPKDVLNENIFSGIEETLFDYLSEDEKQNNPIIKKQLIAYSDAVKSLKMNRNRTDMDGMIDPLHQCFSILQKTAATVENSGLSESGKQVLLVRLAYQREALQQAIVIAHEIEFHPIANVGEVTPGSRFKVSLHAYSSSMNHLNDPQLKLHMPDGWESSVNLQTEGELNPLQETEIVYDVTVPDDAHYRSVYWQYHPTASRYKWMKKDAGALPYAPPPLEAELSFRYNGNFISVKKPVLFRYVNPWGVGYKEKEVSVLPNLSLSINPEILVFTSGNSHQSKTVSVQVQSHQSGPVEADISLQAPDGWTVNPLSIPVQLNEAERNTTVIFEVEPGTKQGKFELQAVAISNGITFDEHVQTIEYQHTEKRFYITPSTVNVLVLPIQTEPVQVGYIMGSGDQVPQALEQLGCQVTMLDETEVTSGDLNQYNMIMLGVRAYLTRQDLRKHNARLLAYVHQGGTVFVQYNKYEFNDAQWGPYPVLVGRDRVTDENAPVRILHPNHPLFRFPNVIDESVWDDWVQERGIYFLGRRSDEYVDLLASQDPFPNNAGEKQGILVEAKYGEGKWLYSGLALFRQLPAGVPGSYTLLANIVGYSQ